MIRIRNVGIAPVKINDVLLPATGSKGGLVFSRIMVEPGTAPLVFPDEIITSVLAQDRSRPVTDLLTIKACDLCLLAQYEGMRAREIRLTSEDQLLIKDELEKYCIGDVENDSNQSIST